MDSSQSAMVSSILSIASLTNDRINLFINLLTGFSSILLSVIAGTFGFSLWKQNELKKEAEKDARKINSLVGKVSKLYEKVQKNTIQATNYLKAAEKLISQVSEKTSKLDPLIANVEKKGKEATESVSEIKQIRKEIERASQSLGTLSVSGPTIYGSPVTFGGTTDFAGEGSNIENASRTIIDDYLIDRKSR